MSYTTEVLNKYYKFIQQDAKLSQLSKKYSTALMTQSQSDTLINNMQILTNIRVELENHLALSGDLAEYFSDIENDVNALEKVLELNGQTSYTPSFTQRLFGSSDIEKLKSKFDVKKLIKLMIAQKGSLSKQAFDTLIEMGIPIIEKLLDTSRDLLRKSKELSAVLLVLKNIGESVVDPLINVLNQNNHTRNEVAIFALGIIGNAKAGDSFIQILESETPENWLSKLIAAHYIGGLLGNKAQNVLLKIINEDDVIVLHKGSKIIVDTLGKIGDQKAVNALKKMMKKDNSDEDAKKDFAKSINKALVNIQKRSGKQKAKSPTVTEDSSDSFYGGFGEPYCSKTCLDKGGKYISSVMLKKQTGVCGFCQKPVEVSMYGEANCGVIPYEGKNLFICSDCAEKGKEFLEDYNKCCMCEKEVSQKSYL